MYPLAHATGPSDFLAISILIAGDRRMRNIMSSIFAHGILFFISSYRECEK